MKNLHKPEFNHYKLENISNLITSIFMFVSFLIVMVITVDCLFHPAVSGKIIFGLVTSFMDAVVNIIFCIKYYRLSLKELSPISESQWRLYRAKTVSNCSVMLLIGPSLIFIGYPWSMYIDPVGSFTVSLFILGSSFEVGRKSLRDLRLCSA